MAIKNDQPFYKCPRYAKCSINNCPLHTAYPDLIVDEGDKAKKCKIAKTIRVRISTEYPGVLKLAGLTLGEHQAKLRYANLSDESKARMQSSLNKVNFRRHIEANNNVLSNSVCGV